MNFDYQQDRMNQIMDFAERFDIDLPTAEDCWDGTANAEEAELRLRDYMVNVVGDESFLADDDPLKGYRL